MRLCSACLLGINCRYDAKSKPHKKAISLSKKENLILVCPEELGGLPTPREPSEIKGGRVVTKSGRDVTENFYKGARQVLKIARIFGIKEAILKQKSPSCGCGRTEDGITTALLKKNGIRIISY